MLAIIISSDSTLDGINPSSRGPSLVWNWEQVIRPSLNSLIPTLFMEFGWNIVTCFVEGATSSEAFFKEQIIKDLRSLAIVTRGC